MRKRYKVALIIIFMIFILQTIAIIITKKDSGTTNILFTFLASIVQISFFGLLVFFVIKRNSRYRISKNGVFILAKVISSKKALLSGRNNHRTEISVEFRVPEHGVIKGIVYKKRYIFDAKDYEPGSYVPICYEKDNPHKMVFAEKIDQMELEELYNKMLKDKETF